MKYALLMLGIANVCLAEKSFEVGAFYEKVDNRDVKYEITGLSFEGRPLHWRGLELSVNVMGALTYDLTLFRTTQELSYPVQFGWVKVAPYIGTVNETLHDMSCEWESVELYSSWLPIGVTFSSNYKGIDFDVKYSHIESVAKITTFHQGNDFDGYVGGGDQRWDCSGKIGYKLRDMVKCSLAGHYGRSYDKVSRSWGFGALLNLQI